MLKPGDRVAVVSPSRGLPELFPGPYELGLRRLRDSFGLEPVEYPTTRRLATTPAERADDLHKAFADPDISALIATIGGEDQLTVVRHLDAELIKANPKPFFGYSDNTNLLVFLHGLGVPCFHGGCVMIEYGRGGAMHPDTEAALRAALFSPGPFELRPADGWTDVERDWRDPENLKTEPPLKPGTGWQWHGSVDRVVEGPLWGGCVEILEWIAAAGRLQPNKSYGGVFFGETSEELPSATAVYRILRNLGERGLLERFDAVLWGRPKAWSLSDQRTPEESATYTTEQYDAVRRTLSEYNPDALLVTGLDIGHTDPNLVLPYGGPVRVDGPARRISVTY